MQNGLSGAERIRNSRLRKESSKTPLIIIGIVVLILLIIYLVVAFRFRGHFFPRTTFDSVDISGMTLEEASEAVDDMFETYEILITDRDGNTAEFSASDAGLSSPDDGLLEETLSSQKAFLWPIYFLTGTNVTQDLSNAYDADAFSAAVDSLSFFSEDYVTEPVNASITYNESDQVYEIESEVMGTTILKDTFSEKLAAVMTSLELTMTLDDSYYENPTVYSDDELVANAVETANSYLSATITYDIEGYDEVLDTDTLAKWISLDSEYNVLIDEDQVTDYVQYLASTYNTYGREREFETALGDTITIGGGDYGWVINKTKEKKKILKNIKSGQPTEREPVYEQTALYRTSNDIGNTYVEIDYTNQHIYYFENGELQLDSDIVSGNTSKGNGSPDGVFKIIYQEKEATLVGEDYESEVQYFMVFSYNVGIHDASWRSEFGGTIYKKSGSHGCVNVPLSFAEDLYAVLQTGTPVVAYYRDSIKLTSENAKTANAYSYVEEDEDE